MDRCDNHSVPRRDGESGSAYIIALMALVVLSILGLGLSLITQTEMQVAAGDVTNQRTLYSADSGLSRSVAQNVGKYSCFAIPGEEFQIADTDLVAGTLTSRLRQEVAVSPNLPVLDAPCPLCMVNNAGGSTQYGEASYYEEHHAVSATASRLIGDDPNPRAQRTTGTFMVLLPWPQIGDCFALSNTPEVDQVKM